MMSDPQKLNEMLRGRALVLKILWTWMTLTVLFFVALAYFLNAPLKPDPREAAPQMRIAFYAVAVAVAIAAYFIRGIILRQRTESASERDAELRRAFNEAQPAASDAAMPAQEKRLKAVEAQAAQLAGRYFNALLLSLALHEVIALLGMLLSMMEHRFESVLPFAIAAIILDLLVYPRLTSYVEQNVLGASSF